jgi:hypothetical protein
MAVKPLSIVTGLKLKEMNKNEFIRTTNDRDH